MKAWILSSSVLILIVILLRMLLKMRVSARIQYAFWLPVLLRLMIPFSVGSSPVSVQNVIPERTVIRSEAERRTQQPEGFVYQGTEKEVIETPVSGPSVAENSASGRVIQNKDVIIIVWIAVAVGVLLTMTGTHLHFLHRLKTSRNQLNITYFLPVFTVSWISTPFLAGVIHPAIYLPKDLPGQPEQLRHVLIHEGSHYRHGDHIWSWLRTAVLALHWYNPLVWFSSILSKHDAELACDETSLRILGDQERKSYGETLLALTSPQFSYLFGMSTAMTESKRSLRERIRYIVRKPKTARSILALLLVFSLFAVIATFTGSAETSTDREVPADTIRVSNVDESIADVDSDITVTPSPLPTAVEVLPGSEITVTTMDEFLSALGPNRTIVLDGELFDLSTASNYGGIGTKYYYWNESKDGPELVIYDVDKLTIHPKDTYAGATTISAVPRFANVVNFKNCNYLRLVNLTLGHTKESGSCSGGVINLQNCQAVTIGGCRLYGCGVLGLHTTQCSTISLTDTEIYECSQGAASFFHTDGIGFLRCSIHDVPSPALTFTECSNITWNSEPVSDVSRMYDVNADRLLAAYDIDESAEYAMAVPNTEATEYITAFQSKDGKVNTQIDLTSMESFSQSALPVIDLEYHAITAQERERIITALFGKEISLYQDVEGTDGDWAWGAVGTKEFYDRWIEDAKWAQESNELKRILGNADFYDYVLNQISEFLEKYDHTKKYEEAPKNADLQPLYWGNGPQNALIESDSVWYRVRISIDSTFGKNIYKWL